MRELIPSQNSEWLPDALYSDRMIERSPSDFAGDKELLIRIDERVLLIIKEVQEMKLGFVRKEEYAELKREVNEKVSKDEFEPVRKFVFGSIALALSSLAAAVFALVLK
jgi:hypothetical protein